MLSPQQTKMAQEDLEAIVAAILAAGATHEMSAAQTAATHYSEILEALRAKGVYGNARNRRGAHGPATQSGRI